jgi:hypothetical protein
MSFLAGTNISGQSSLRLLLKRYVSFAPHFSRGVTASVRPESPPLIVSVGSWSVVEETETAVVSESMTVAVTLCRLGLAPPAVWKVTRYCTNRAPPA